MNLRTDRRPVYEITRVGPYSGGRDHVRKRRRWPWVLGLVLVAVLAALGAAYFAWPRGGLAPDAAGIARVSRPGLGVAATSVTVHAADGTPIPVTVRADGTIWPRRPVAPGTRMVVDAQFRRPGWAAWIAGETQRVTLRVTAPSATVKQRWLRVRPGSSLVVRFSAPVRAVALSGVKASPARVLPRPTRIVPLAGLGAAGSVGVSGVVRSWEQTPPPVEITWFPLGGPARILVSPARGTELGLHTPLRLTVSEPVEKLFHGHLPWLSPAVPGSWRVVDQHTLVFRPRGYGFGLDTDVKLRLPAAVRPTTGDEKPTRLLTWTTPTGSQLRLEQLLATLGYLPLHWQPSGADAPATTAAQVAAAAQPPDGRFSWRYPNVPQELVGLWKLGRWNVVTRGAVMAFESSHDLTTDGYAGRQVWQALIADAIAGKRAAQDGYSYVIVHRSGSPQSLTLWRDGQTILTTAANTGIPKAPTALGTYPVYARFVSTTMSGTNPDGTKYHDTGVPWVSYFNGGDAIHGFNRGSYGSAQSLGCVELPPSEAAKVFPYTPIGTLVTVTS